MLMRWGRSGSGRSSARSSARRSCWPFGPRRIPDIPICVTRMISSAGDFYGGFIGGLVAAGLFFWRHPRLPFWRSADVAAPAIALGQAIGRIGCFMAGDDFGRSTGVPWSVTFTEPLAANIGGAPLGVPLHPVQLYESVFCAVLFVWLAWLGPSLASGRRRHRHVHHPLRRAAGSS